MQLATKMWALAVPHSPSIRGEKFDYGEYDPELGVEMNDNDEHYDLDEVGSLPTSFASKRRSSQEDFEASEDQQFVSRSSSHIILWEKKH